MEFISLVCPAFISLAIYLCLFDKQKNILKSICYYFICNLIVNFLVLFVVVFVFHQNELTFTSIFTLKYLALASLLSAILPFVIEFIKKKLSKLCKKIDALLKTGMTSNNKFSYKLFYRKNEKLSNNVIFVLSSFLYFYVLEIVIRLTAVSMSGFGSSAIMAAFVFTFLYYFIFVALQYVLPKAVAKIFSILGYICCFVLFLANYMLLHIKSEALSIGELTNASEGFKFLNFLLKEIRVLLIITIIIAIALAVINYMFLDKVRKRKIKIKKRYYLFAIILIVFLHAFAVLLLPTTDDIWEVINKPRYYYDNFINSKKSLAVLGLYEYTVRDTYLSVKGRFTKFGNTEEIEKTIDKYSVQKEKNDYTGVFKDKNLIMIMLESVDYVAINEETTPTISRLMKEGWTFPNRYSALSAGGSTIQTEYSSLSGLFYDTNYYVDIFNNNYNYALPNLFSKAGYVTSSMHENNGSYYNRQKLHSILGFQNSYFLNDISSDVLQFEDPQMADNEEFYDMIIPSDADKFMSLFITISAHGPYDTSNYFCKKADQANSDEECFSYLINKTDVFINHLIKKLSRDNLLDDTVIVLYTDHQAYSYNYPEEYVNTLPVIDTKKNIKAVPFVIYNKDISHKEFNNLLVNDIDLVPTLLNLFDINYDPNNYIGVDLFSKDHKNLILFNDFTWYDGKVYSANEGVDTTTDSYKENSQYVADKINLNSMILSNNYFKN